MALRIVNNLAAMNTQRWLGVADTGMKKSLERLSSGYRINRAADDAAGLAISQGFRADIASFKVASRNASEAAAMLQVAEGGMDQIGNMLTRLKELATQAASSNVGTTERAKINSEGNALVSEIDRIANSTKYGSTSLLDGTFGASKAAGTWTGGVDDKRIYGEGVYGYDMAEGVVSGIGDTDLTITGVGKTLSAAVYIFSATATLLKLGNGAVTESVALPVLSAGETVTFANLGITFTVDCGISSSQWADSTITLRDTGLSNLNIAGADSGTYVFSSTTAALTLGNGTATQTISDFDPGTAKSFNFDALGITLNVGTLYTDDDLDAVEFTVTSTGSGGSTFQIGAQNNSDNQIALTIAGVTAATLNSGLAVDNLDTQAEAQSMLTTIDSAISQLSGTRGDIGASMNRLSYASANLATTIENQQAAESVIRDVDMAAEMTDFTKNQILLQAGTAMLAQANMAPQQVLALFG